MKTILFDEHCAGWTVNRERNELFLTLQRNYLVELLLVKGYVYLNQIYECLGIKWDPTNDNFCWYGGKPLIIEFEPFGYDDQYYLVHIQ